MAGTAEKNLIASVLVDLGRFLKLMGHLIVDQDYSRELIGFPVNQSLVPNAVGLGDALETAAQGKAALPEYVEAAGKLAELSEAIRLAVEAAEADLPAGVLVLEAVETLIDTLGLGYVAARWPSLLYVARLLNLLTENLPPDETVEAAEAVGAELWSWVRPDFFVYIPERAWDALSSPLETEEDARGLSASLAALGLLLALTPTFVAARQMRTIDPEVFQVLHGWETDPASATPIADGVSKRFVTLIGRLSGETTNADGDTVEGTAELTLTVALVPREHGGPGVWLSFGLGGGTDLHLGGGWHFVIEGELDDAFDVFIPGSTAPADAGFARSGAAVGGKGELRIERREEGDQAGQPAQPWRLGGVLEVKTAELALTYTDREPFVELVARLRDAALVVERPESGFFRSLVPADGVRVNFDVGVIVDGTPQIQLEGGAGASVLIPIHTSTPKLQGLHVYLALTGRRKGETTGPRVALEASVGFATKLGAFSATVDRFGMILPEAPHAPSFAKWLKFPNAVGIGVDAEAVRGGGFLLFEPERGRYQGVLSLTFARYTLTAFGLITDLPDGYSLLLVCSLEISPPWQGPFGIGLAGIGAVIGHNHGADVPALQSSLRTGSIGTILFPPDPIAAAPRVLTTLAGIFPVRPGSSLFGIGLKLSWSGGLVSLSAAVVIESGPTPRTLVLASLKGVAPSEHLPIVRIQVDAAGVIDSKRPSVEVDGSIVRSFVGPFALTGDGVFRFHGGDDGLFLLAVGGFHPSYTPPPTANLPPQRRLTLAFPTENPRVRMELYWAVTSNSVQAGARLEISARKGGFSAEAILGFDALVEFEPFHLSVDIEGRAAIRYDGSTIASVGLDLHVRGPHPWKVDGKARLELLFFTVTIPIHYDPGPETSQIEQASADAAALLTAGLADDASWQTLQPSGAAALVAIRSAGAENGHLRVHPAGQLGVRQGVLPLGVDVTHIGAARITPDRFDVELTIEGANMPTSDVRAPFAAGQFLDLSEDERLSRPAFERFVAGAAVDEDGVVHGSATSADLTYEEIVLGPDGPIDETPPIRPGLHVVLAHAVGLGPAASSPLRRDEAGGRLRGSPLVTLAAATSALVDAATLGAVPGARPAETETELRQQIDGLGGGTAVLVVQAHEARS